MSYAPDYHVILVTADPGLRAAVRRRQPLGARLLCVAPDEWDRRPDLLADQVWIDLDHRPQRDCERSQRCTYLYSDSRSVPKTLSTETLMRKPGPADPPGALWAGVAIDSPADSSAHCPGGGCLPGWLLQLSEIELAPLLQAIQDTLPKRLGFDDIAVYLHSPADNKLTLARTSLRKPIDRRIALDDPIHAIAAAARQACVQLNGLRTIIPLVHESECVGVIQLDGRPDGREGDTEHLARIGAIVARYIAHACQFERVRTEGRIDGLTGLFNYRWMRESMQKEVRRAKRFATPLSVLAIDLDNLKQLNDEHGHLAGDACLRRLATTISSCLRQIDSAARIGGDEFLTLLPRTNWRGARRVAERIIRGIGAAGQTPTSTASIGVCQLADGWDVQRLLGAADQAMYQAKRAGGNRAVVHGQHHRPRHTSPGARPQLSHRRGARVKTA